VSDSQIVLRESDIQHKIQRLAAQILEECADVQPLGFVGIYNRGVELAKRVFDLVKKKREDVFFGTLDISLYRDDFDNRGDIPTLKSSDIDFDLQGCHVVLFDDVLFTGRTTRAAIDALTAYGRPSCIQLATLVDRGNRELPISADYVGETLETSREDYVHVRLQGPDNEESVSLIKS
tara:strand:- start:43199 stop:43732 length:534 start_codon:yes stop_codon:yes gene_type:complete